MSRFIDLSHPVEEDMEALSYSVLRAATPRFVTCAASWVRDETPSLPKIEERCAWTVRLEMNNLSPISGLVSPSAASRTTCSNRGGIFTE
jgi:hypothetical protein